MVFYIFGKLCKQAHGAQKNPGACSGLPVKAWSPFGAPKLWEILRRSLRMEASQANFGTDIATDLAGGSKTV